MISILSILAPKPHSSNMQNLPPSMFMKMEVSVEISKLITRIQEAKKIIPRIICLPIFTPNTTFYSWTPSYDGLPGYKSLAFRLLLCLSPTLPGIGGFPCTVAAMFPGSTSYQIMLVRGLHRIPSIEGDPHFKPHCPAAYNRARSCEFPKARIDRHCCGFFGLINDDMESRFDSISHIFLPSLALAILWEK